MNPKPWHPDDDEHRLPPPPTPEWLRRLALNRRHFLKIGLGGLGLTLAGTACSAPPPAPAPPDRGPEPAAPVPPSAEAGDAIVPPTPAPGALPAALDPVNGPPILVVVQLSGGNDGLNTVVPYTDDLYYRHRPTLAVAESAVLKLDDRIGLHPNLAGLLPLWDAGELALIQSVGYPNPNRSHFRSMDIYHTAEPAKLENYGWLGKYLDIALRDSDSPFKAVHIGSTAPKALWARETPVATIREINAFQLRTNPRFNEDRQALLTAFERLAARTGGTPDPVFERLNRTWTTTSEGARLLQGAAGGYRSSVKYPPGQLASSLQLIAALIQADLGTRVFYTELGGFDDHAAEKNVHDRLLAQVGDSLAAFYGDLKAMGLANRVLILTFSEFGRRVRENASAGTDHGAAQPLFALGGRVRGGSYGRYPSLSDLDDGDLRFDIDFRAVYSNVLTEWLGVAGRDVVGHQYESLGFIST